MVLRRIFCPCGVGGEVTEVLRKLHNEKLHIFDSFVAKENEMGVLCSMHESDKCT
jgi:hypothetical protein